MRLDEIQLRPEWSGICGSDLHIYLAGPILVPATPHKLTSAAIPITFRHKASCVVVVVESNVTTQKVGDKVR